MLDFYNLNDNPSIYENNGKVKHVKTSIKAFCTEKDQECQMKSYLNMLSVIEGFIVEEQNKETVFYVVDRLIGTKIYDYIPKISNSFVAVIQTLRILPQLESISKKTPPPIILNLFSSSCLFSSKQKQLIQLSKNYFTRVFSLKDFGLLCASLYQMRFKIILYKQFVFLNQKRYRLTSTHFEALLILLKKDRFHQKTLILLQNI